MSLSLVANRIARAVALPTAAPSVRIFFILASGLNGLPLLMPIALNSPRISGSKAEDGSSWITAFTSWKKLKSLAWMVLNDLPDQLTNWVGGGFSASARAYIFKCFFILLTPA